MVSVITNVSLDHQKRLGGTVKEIAFEKAGIIKPNGVVVTAAKNDALEVIQSICEKNIASLNMITEKMITVEETSFTHQTIIFHGFFDDYLVTTHQLGLYQPINIAVSITTIEALQQQGVFVTKESIYKGIQQMNHPGRMQLVRKHPFFLLDGAHNVDAMKQMVASVKKLFTFDRLILIFGVMKDKCIREMLTEILPITDIAIVTKPDQKRAAKSEDIAHFILEIDMSKQIILTNSVVDAYHKAFEIAKKDDLILGTGSLFTVGELIAMSEAD
jgi:dihydrofolate synthase / folylpolyglutamate synthase